MKKNFFTKVFSPIALLTRDYSEDFEEFASAKMERTSSNEPETITQVLNLHTFFFLENINQHSLDLFCLECKRRGYNHPSLTSPKFKI